MPKLKTVTVKNFKLLKNVTLGLSNLNLLTGVNSTGKSTFIQSLLLLMQNKKPLKMLEMINLLEKSISKGKVYPESLKALLANEKINFNGVLMELGAAKDVLHQDSYNEKIEIELDAVNKSIRVTVDPNSLSATIKDLTKGKGSSSVMSILDEFQYLHTDRIQPQNIYDLSSVRVNDGRLGIHGEYTAHYLEENKRNDIEIKKLKHPDSKTYQLLENVSLWLSEISQGVSVLVKKYPEIQKASLSYQYTYSDTTSNEYSPLNVGFGLTYALPIIVALLKARPGEVVIIENPESHLHPRGQVKVAQLCALTAQQGVQLIVESHSDHFLNGLRVATKQNQISAENIKFFYFSKNTESLSADITELTLDESGRINEDWPEGFFDEYSKQMDELLW